MQRARTWATTVVVTLGLVLALMPSVDAAPTAHRRVTQIAGWRAPATASAIGGLVVRRVHVSGPGHRWVVLQRAVDGHAVKQRVARTDARGNLTVRLPVLPSRTYYRLVVSRTSHYTSRHTPWIRVAGTTPQPKPTPTPTPTSTPTPSSSASAAPSGVSTAIDVTNRDAVLAAYLNTFKPTTWQTVEWNGDEATCKAGGVTDHFRQQTLIAVNYFRAMVGVAPVSLDDLQSEQAQQAALVMDANRRLDHHPATSWACWSQAAYDGASHSNLFIWAARSGPDPTLTAGQPIAGYMSDPWVESVGHRLWIMYPYSTTMGVGATQHAQALWVVPSSPVKVTAAHFMTWPTPGYFPSALVPSDYWSFSATDGTSLEAASVSVFGPDGTPLEVSGIHMGAGILGSTLVWTVHPPKPQADTTYTVHITGPVDHTYKVTIIPVP